MFAYIPARIGSKRIPRKNIKILDGKPLIMHVIQNLSKLKSISGIAVSTDSNEIRNLCLKNRNVECLELRNQDLADDKTGFMELVKYDLPRYCDFFQENTFIFCLPTAILIKTIDFEKAIKDYNISKQGILISCVKYSISPYLAIEKQDHKYTPLFPKHFSKDTASLPETFADAGCFYILNRKNINNAVRFIDMQPIVPFIIDKNKGIDLDNLSDWEHLKTVYQSYNKS
tara:strand:- start:32 stop:718 length:687 start_codon:yes stop_codon:yes gene_type:complete